MNPSAKLGFYESSTRAATSLWRYAPARINDCPVVTTMTVTVGYRIR